MASASILFVAKPSPPPHPQLHMKSKQLTKRTITSCSAVKESSTSTVATDKKEEEIKQAPPKPKAPAKAPAKALPQMMEEDIIPSLIAVLETPENELSHLELFFQDNKTANPSRRLALQPWKSCSGIVREDSTQQAIKDLVRHHQPTILFSCETKIYSSSSSNLSVGQTGGLLMLWRDCINVRFRSDSKYHIDVDVGRMFADPKFGGLIESRLSPVKLVKPVLQGKGMESLGLLSVAWASTGWAEMVFGLVD